MSIVNFKKRNFEKVHIRSRPSAIFFFIIASLSPSDVGKLHAVLLDQLFTPLVLVDVIHW